MKILPLAISTIKHPSECDTSKGEFQIPLIFKPEFHSENIIKNLENKFLYIIPMTMSSIKDRIRMVDYYAESSIGCAINSTDKFEDIIELSKYVKYLYIDNEIGTGYSAHHLDFVMKLRESINHYTMIISGDVGNYFGVKSHLGYGADLVRFGINNKGLISTDGLNSLPKLQKEIRILHGKTQSHERNNSCNKTLIYSDEIRSPDEFSMALLYSEWVLIKSYPFSVDRLLNSYKESLQNIMIQLNSRNLEEYKKSRFEIQ